MNLLPASDLFQQYFTESSSGVEALSEMEKQFTLQYAPKRLRDFCTGRHCAHKALEGITTTPQEVLMKHNGEPIWPKETIGSISHSGHLTGSIVSKKSILKSIGLDIETIGEVKEELWPILFTDRERNWLNGISNAQQKIQSTILFSMKECAFKLQYPLTGEFIEFTDAEITHEKNEYVVRSLTNFENKHLIPEYISVHYIQVKDQIITWAVL